MKRLHFLFSMAMLALSSMLFMSACESDLPEDGGKEIVLSRSEQEMVSQGNGFTFNFLNQMIGMYPGKNLLLSPLSLSEVLAMLANGANGDTHSEILNTLGFTGNSMEEVNAYLKTLHSGLLAADPRTKLALANSVWIADEVTVKNTFTEALKVNYDAEVNVLPFDDKMVGKVNDWCTRKTYGKITKFLDEVPRAEMILLNALYFKGSWKEKFNKNKTAEKVFYREGGFTMKADFMRGTFETHCYSDKEEPFKVLRLPYGNNAFSMIIALPDEGLNVDEFAQSITAEEWQRWINGMKEYSEVYVEMPKFKQEFDFNLKETLKAMGINEIFAATADFSGISDDNGLYVDEIKQKTYIEVNEDGSTVAAVTGMSGCTSPGFDEERPKFIINRPFIYAIQERSSGAILFVGKIAEP